MIWAIKGDERIKATPKEKAVCPLCDEEVISKCGQIKIWHWSHKKDFVCDTFGEPETLWHLEWKNYFNKVCQEVIIGKHRADIKTKKGLIIEVQNSPISSEQIIDRELFYEKMIWILNGKTIGKNIVFFKRRYKWKWYPKSWDHSMIHIISYIDKQDGFLYKLFPLTNTFLKLSKNAFIIEHGGNPFK